MACRDGRIDNVPSALDLIAKGIVNGSDHVWGSAGVDDAFGAHLAACLSEGVCPFGHPLDPGTEGLLPTGGRLCRHCEPPAIWLAAQGQYLTAGDVLTDGYGWQWARLAPESAGTS